MAIKIILIGAPGSGKGTQAKKLIEDTAANHLATGDMLREAMKNGTELGKKAKQFIDKGELVPDALIIDMMEEKLRALPADQGLILDGFPRTIPQAESLDQLFAKLGIKLDKVIDIEVSLEEIITRMSGRLTCTTCGRSYHKVYNKPKNDMVCDNDGTPLIVREDDKEDVVRGRYMTFKKQTQPLVDYYKQKGLVAEINGEQDIKDIYNDIKKILNV